MKKIIGIQIINNVLVKLFETIYEDDAAKEAFEEIKETISNQDRYINFNFSNCYCLVDRSLGPIKIMFNND